MREIFSLAFDELTGTLGLDINPFVEWLILFFIGVIAYSSSYKIVGDLYRLSIIMDKCEGSLLHWITRIIVFVLLWAITNGIIKIGRLAVNHPIIALVIFALVVAVICIISFIVYRKKRQHKQI